MSTLFFVEIVEGLSPRNLIERPGSKDDGIPRCDLSLGAQVPSTVDEVRRTECAARSSVLVAAKPHEVNCHVTLQKQKTPELLVLRSRLLGDVT
jgi:hypothetical protein